MKELSDRKNQYVALQDMVKQIIGELEKPCCNKESHRVKPRDGEDWFAIYNTMHLWFANYTAKMSDVLNDLMSEEVLSTFEPEYRAQILEDVKLMVAIGMLLRPAFTLLSKEGQTKNADLFHQRILGMAEQEVVDSLNALSEMERFVTLLLTPAQGEG